MLLEDAAKIYFGDIRYLVMGDRVKCKDHPFWAHSKAGIVIHLRKEHDIYIAKGDSKRKLYKHKDILPTS